MSSPSFPDEFCSWCGNYCSCLPGANWLRKIINDDQKKPGLADRQRYPFYLGWPRSVELSATFLCFNRTASRCVRLRKRLDLSIARHLWQRRCPRGFNAPFALIRIGAGIALLSRVRSGLNLITLIFATYLTVEGIFGIFGALKHRREDGWIFMLFNGMVTSALGIMVYAHWPSGSRRDSGVIFRYQPAVSRNFAVDARYCRLEDRRLTRKSHAVN
jgi:hypothetical protein